MTQRRLFRDSSNEVIGGVASGLAKYFDVDVTIVRILFVLAGIFGGWGVIVYIIFWIAVPRKTLIDQDTSFNQDQAEKSPPKDYSENKYRQTDVPEQEQKSRGGLIGGTILIIIGTFFIMERYIPRIDFDDFWPFLLVLIGLTILFSGFLKSGRNER
ncbi:MAG: PspC domain-containing protein [Bacteroidetes bacterium]|nr:PspC domain-containing protein [Bacteroidota bacterium]